MCFPLKTSRTRFPKKRPYLILTFDIWTQCDRQACSQHHSTTEHVLLFYTLPISFLLNKSTQLAHRGIQPLTQAFQVQSLCSRPSGLTMSLFIEHTVTTSYSRAFSQMKLLLFSFLYRDITEGFSANKILELKITACEMDRGSATWERLLGQVLMSALQHCRRKLVQYRFRSQR